MTTTLLNNRYQIISALGSGGFGETFLAEDTQMPSRRRCVIKQLKPVTGDRQTYQLIKERFGREAAVLENLGEKHNQIPKLYAYFELNGEFYLVQECISGETLTNKVQKSGQFSDRQVRDLLASLLPVLDFVHNQKMLHRDIKPDNIIFRQSDGFPVLIDFGAVKETMNTVVTSSGGGVPSIAIGTPGFMPAEQAAGRPVYSSDLYALGMTGIYLLTGKMPQELETDSRTGQILWRNYAPQVSPNLALVLDRAIRFNPGDRYHTASEMLNALQPQNQGNVASNMATVAVSPRYSPGTSQTTTTNSGQSSKVVWLPIAIVGVIIFSATFAGSFAIMQNKKTSNSSPSSDSTNQPTVTDNSRWSDNPNSTGDNNSNYPENNPNSGYPDSTASTNNTSPPTNQSSPPETQPQTQPENTNIPPTPEKNPPAQTQPQTQPETSNIPPTPEKKPPAETQPEIELEISTDSSNTEANQPSEPVAKPSRSEAIRNYYNLINQREYSATWDQLSSNFKATKSGSYEDYTGWWNQVKEVKVSKTNVREVNQDTALVNTELTYYMKDGRVSPERLEILLIWDADSQQWLIDQTRRY
jgi:serine/threonine-protein kinase